MPQVLAVRRDSIGGVAEGEVTKGIGIWRGSTAAVQVGEKSSRQRCWMHGKQVRERESLYRIAAFARGRQLAANWLTVVKHALVAE